MADQKSAHLKKEMKKCKDALSKEQKRIEGSHIHLRKELDSITKIIKEIKDSGNISRL